MYRNYFTKPSINYLEVNYAADAGQNGRGDNCYKYIEFEDAFKNYLGIQYAGATSSCTGSLNMGLSSLGIGHRDKVIFFEMNWIESAAPITCLGAVSVLEDVLPDNW